MHVRAQTVHLWSKTSPIKTLSTDWRTFFALPQIWVKWCCVIRLQNVQLNLARFKLIHSFSFTHTQNTKHTLNIKHTLNTKHTH
jgi:hypothetical protein